MKIAYPRANLASCCRFNPCSKTDDALVRESPYKIIVGSATDMSDCLSYHTVAVPAEPTEKVVVLAFEDIDFNFDKATLKPEAQTMLKRNIQQKLSERRANAVKGYLVSEGLIPSDRFSILAEKVLQPIIVATKFTKER